MRIDNVASNMRHTLGAGYAAGGERGGAGAHRRGGGRGLHLSTFQLTLSRLWKTINTLHTPKYPLTPLKPSLRF